MINKFSCFILTGFAFFYLIFPISVQAESLDDALQSTLNALPLRDWQAAYDQAFPEGEDFSSLVLRLARGDLRLDGETLLRSLAARFLGALTSSAWRLTRLIVPAVFCGVLQRLKASFAKAAVGEAL